MRLRNWAERLHGGQLAILWIVLILGSGLVLVGLFVGAGINREWQSSKVTALRLESSDLREESRLTESRFDGHVLSEDSIPAIIDSHNALIETLRGTWGRDAGEQAVSEQPWVKPWIIRSPGSRAEALAALRHYRDSISDAADSATVSLAIQERRSETASKLVVGTLFAAFLGGLVVVAFLLVTTWHWFGRRPPHNPA